MTFATRRARSGMLAVAFALSLVAPAAFFHLRIPKVPDPDSLYHIQHAALYRTHGILMTGFPWLPFSVVDRYASDIWYGFHLLLLPCTLIDDPVLEIKVPGV